MTLFPDTRHSVIDALSSSDAPTRERAAETVARVYRAPIVAVLQQKWSLDLADAEDLAHDFLAHAFARDWLPRYDQSKGRFRTFLRSCLAAYASTAHEHAGRLKRGGGAQHVSLDAAAFTPSADATIDQLFEREWVRSVFTAALDTLRAECVASGHAVHYAVFVRYDIESAELEQRPTYGAVASEFGLPLSQVTNYLNWARRRFRACVLETLRALTANDAEFRDEARALLGVHVP